MKIGYFFIIKKSCPPDMEWSSSKANTALELFF